MLRRIEIRRAARVPDPTRVARYGRLPELGPRVLFFSGGSALRKHSRKLKRFTHNSVHLVTPFDSGGSSAALRRAFGMLSVGDLRNRLLSLADETALGNPEIYALFSHRLRPDGEPEVLRKQLEQMIVGEHPLVARVPEPMQQIVRTHLRQFFEPMPSSFDLRSASIGNLIIAGGYLNNDRNIEAVIFLFSKLVQVRGLVRPIVDEDLHLRARLDSGEIVVGQHNLTGKQVEPIRSPVAELSLVESLEDPRPVETRISEEVGSLIRGADLICFPIGSFYSSVVANLLPAGVGQAIVEARCPKVYVPNMAADPEQIGMSLAGSVSRLLEAVRRDAGADTPASSILDLVLVDRAAGRYELPLDESEVRALGVEIADVPLVRSNGWPLIDADALTETLLCFV